jgi:acetylornithine/succinyldiaminopimelate/putrescine aminotransferase
MKVFDSDGREYLDFVSGVAVNNLGHCHPRVVVALQKQAQRLMHVSNHYHNEPQINLAKMLVQNSFGDKAFFCNSGTEAIEAALKLARRYSREVLHLNRFEIITMRGSFHGRTMGALSATAQEKFHKTFEPLVDGFRYVPYNDADAVERAVNEHTCAVLVEPIQGEGGVNVPAAGYLSALRDICDRHNLLLMLDEVQTGMGRTGKLFAYEHTGVTPMLRARQRARRGHGHRRIVGHGQGRPGPRRIARFDLRRQSSPAQRPWLARRAPEDNILLRPLNSRAGTSCRDWKT